MRTLKISNLVVDYKKPETQKFFSPLLFIHGMWGGSWYWKKFMKYFAQQGFECYAPNLRGHWGSKKTKDIGKTSILDYISDIQEVIQYLKTKYLGAPILIGHSMGGLIAQKIIEINELFAIRAGILICPAPPHGIPLKNIMKPMGKQPNHLFSTTYKRPIKLSYRLAVKAMLECLDEKNRRRVYEKLVPESGLASKEIALGAVNVDETKIHCPILIIACKKDKIVPAEVVKQIAQKYNGNIELKEYENHAHWVVEENGWELIAEDIKSWIVKILIKKKMYISSYQKALENTPQTLENTSPQNF